jgi:hypothetical protein
MMQRFKCCSGVGGGHALCTLLLLGRKGTRQRRLLAYSLLLLLRCGCSGSGSGALQHLQQPRPTTRRTL